MKDIGSMMQVPDDLLTEKTLEDMKELGMNHLTFYEMFILELLQGRAGTLVRDRKEFSYKDLIYHALSVSNPRRRIKFLKLINWFKSSQWTNKEEGGDREPYDPDITTN